MRFRVFGPIVMAFVLSLAGRAYASSIVLNGSFEDLGGNFVNGGCNYMEVDQGSTAITGWAVTASVPRGIAWAKSTTCDSFDASDATYAIDLTGLGANSFNGTIEQQLTTTIGQLYFFSIDLGGRNNGAVAVSIGGNLLTLTAGTPFTVGTTSWTPYTSSFTALTSNPFLTLQNLTGGRADIMFLDNVSIVAAGPAAVPEPASLALLGLGLAALGATTRRWRS